MKLIRSIVTISLYTIASRIAGFVRTAAMAAFLGAGVLSDALSLAIKVPSLFRRMFAEGAMNAAFIPMFARILASEGENDAKSFAEEILSILVYFLALMTVLVEIFLPQILSYCLPGFHNSPERLYYTIEFTRITFPFIFLISLTALYSGILNSLERFAAVASSPIAGNIGIIVISLGLISLHVTPTPGHAFAWGVLLSGFIQWVWVLRPCHQQKMNLKLRYPRFSPRVKKFFQIFGPAALGSGVVQLNIFLDMLIASYLPVGGVSYLSYADRLNQLPLSMLGTAVGTAMLPLLSKQLRRDQLKEAEETQNLAMEYSLLLTMPAMIGLIMLAYPLTKVLIEHHHFKLQDTLETSKTLMALATGLPAYIFVKIFSTIFFSRQDTKTPVIVAGLAVLVNLILNLSLIGPFQHMGLALATSIAGWFNAGLLGFILMRKGALSFNLRLKKFLPRLLGTSLATIVFLWVGKRMAMPWVESHFGYQVLAVSLLVIGGLASFIFLARLTKALDIQDFKYQLKAEKSSS